MFPLLPDMKDAKKLEAYKQQNAIYEQRIIAAGLGAPPIVTNKQKEWPRTVQGKLRKALDHLSLSKAELKERNLNPLVAPDDDLLPPHLRSLPEDRKRVLWQINGFVFGNGVRFTAGVGGAAAAASAGAGAGVA